MDVNVAKAIDSFQPVAIENPSSAGSKAFVKLSQELLAKVQRLAGGVEKMVNDRSRSSNRSSAHQLDARLLGGLIQVHEAPAELFAN